MSDVNAGSVISCLPKMNVHKSGCITISVEEMISLLNQDVCGNQFLIFNILHNNL
jgi:hypothetical protein